MKDDTSSNGWELEEASEAGDRWVLEESEQQLAEEWDLEGTPEPVGQWQPVEYDKPRRGGPAWILPTVVTVALLAVLGFSAFTLVPELVTAVREGAVDLAQLPFGQQQQPLEPLSPAVVAAEAEATFTPTAASPTETSVLIASAVTEAAPPTPTLMPTLALPQKLFATVLSEYGVNLRNGPSEDSEIKEILDKDSTYVVLGKPNQKWLQLFVSDGPLEGGAPITGYVGYASAEYFAEGMQPMSEQVWLDVLKAVGIEPTPTPAPPTPTPTPAPPTPTPEVVDTPVGVALPTVTPIQPAVEASDVITETAEEAGESTAESDAEANTEATPNAEASAEAVDETGADAVKEADATETAEPEQAGDDIDAADGEDVGVGAQWVTEEPVAETDAGTTDTITEAVTIIIDAVAGLNVRTKPELNAAVVTLLEDKAEAPAIGRYANDEWILVDLGDGATGWVYTELVKLSGELEALPSITLGELPSPTAIPANTPTPEPTPIPPTVEPPAPYSSQLPEGVPGAVVYSAAGVNARQLPVAGSDVITILPENAALPVTGRTADNEWLQVELPQGGLAWLYRATVLPRGNVNAAPVISGEAAEASAESAAEEPTAEEPSTEEPAADDAYSDEPVANETVVEESAAEEPAEKEESAAPASAKMRQVVVPVFSAPSLVSERLAQYGRGTILTATGQSADGGWVQVIATDGQTGWVTAKSVDVSTDGGALPVVN